MEVKKTNMEFVRFTISKIFRGEIDLLRVEGGGGVGVNFFMSS